jgi:ribose transport system ATP-binding protein
MTHCDCLNVLRDGCLIATLEQADFSAALVKKYMVGREIGEKYYREDYGRPVSEQVVLKADNISSGIGIMTNTSLELHKGEILGVAGLSDSGMHELGHALFGELKLATGEVTVQPSGETVTSVPVAMAHGIGYVSKDRDQEALVLTASMRDNIIAAGFDKVSNRMGLISRRAEKGYVERQVQALSIKCASIDQNVQYLSGGNKQKVVFGKWVGRDSKILILDCPTRGVDIGVKTAMYQLMDDMAKEGRSVVIISEEMTELIGMCDRILVIKKGRVNGEFLRSTAVTESHILDCMI